MSRSTYVQEATHYIFCFRKEKRNHYLLTKLIFIRVKVKFVYFLSTYVCLCKLCQYLQKTLFFPLSTSFPSPSPSLCSSHAETLFSIFPLLVNMMHNLCFQRRSETQRGYKKSIKYYF